MRWAPRSFSNFSANTEGLEPLVAREIWRIIRVIRESGIATVLVDKNWRSVSDLTDRNMILVKGRVVFE